MKKLFLDDIAAQTPSVGGRVALDTLRSYLPVDTLKPYSGGGGSGYSGSGGGGA